MCCYRVVIHLFNTAVHSAEFTCCAPKIYVVKSKPRGPISTLRWGCAKKPRCKADNILRNPFLGSYAYALTVSLSDIWPLIHDIL